MSPIEQSVVPLHASWRDYLTLTKPRVVALIMLTAVVGTLLSAEIDHRQADYARPALILMGNEQQGLPPDMAALCDVNVKIPMRGRADSLNLAVATGIMIYAAS